jgi:hypothetical protein
MPTTSKRKHHSPPYNIFYDFLWGATSKCHFFLRLEWIGSFLTVTSNNIFGLMVKTLLEFGGLEMDELVDGI